MSSIQTICQNHFKKKLDSIFTIRHIVSDFVKAFDSAAQELGEKLDKDALYILSNIYTYSRQIGCD
jgi:hypothetical protein